MTTSHAWDISTTLSTVTRSAARCGYDRRYGGSLMPCRAERSSPYLSRYPSPGVVIPDGHRRFGRRVEALRFHPPGPVTATNEAGISLIDLGIKRPSKFAKPSPDRTSRGAVRTLPRLMGAIPWASGPVQRTKPECPSDADNCPRCMLRTRIVQGRLRAWLLVPRGRQNKAGMSLRIRVFLLAGAAPSPSDWPQIQQPRAPARGGQCGAHSHGTVGDFIGHELFKPS